MSRLIKTGDITKDVEEKAIQFHGTFHGLKITEWMCRLQIFYMMKSFYPVNHLYKYKIKQVLKQSLVEHWLLDLATVPTGVGFLYEAGHHTVSIRSRTH